MAVSGSLEHRVTEYVDHLHEHFTDPCVVRDGHYVLPEQPGYSAQILDSTIAEFTFPGGGYWRAQTSDVPGSA